MMKKLIAFLIVAFYVIPLFAGMSSGMFVLPSGTDGQILTYDSTEPNNIKFATPATANGAQDLQGLTRQMLLENYTATQEQTFAALPSDASEGTWNSVVADILEADSMSVASNILTVDTTSVSGASSAYYLAPDVDFNAGYTYEIRTQIVTSATADGRCLLGFIRDGTHSRSVSINANTTSIIVTGAFAAVTIPMDTTTYHTYRLCVLVETWKLFVDDVLMAQGVAKTEAGADDVRFGDISTTADANSKFYVSELNYILGTSATNHTQFRLVADCIFVGSTKLVNVDTTINLTDDLDTGSAAVSTIYNIELLSSGTLQFTLNSTTPGRFVGGVLTDATTATAFVPCEWTGLACRYVDKGMVLLSGSVTSSFQRLSLGAKIPITAQSIHGTIYRNSSSSAFIVSYDNLSTSGFAVELYTSSASGITGNFSIIRKETLYYKSSSSTFTGTINISGYTESI